ncbi:MAG: hypothetical protein PVF82_07035 [Gammaproteobacteria bacterium]|jgi:hypothetical protein
MFGFIKTKPLLDEDTTHWLFDAFAWSLKNFDSQVFYQETILVTPSNQHFPGRESSAHGMADLIFEQVKTHAGLKHWPCHLVDNNDPRLNAPAQVMLEGPLRGSQADSNSVNTAQAEEARQLLVPYNINQLAKPEALIANYAHILAHYLGQTAGELPPGGEPFWPQATELLAIFMGFGVMVANSAYTFRGGCGSCYNPLAERSAFLSQDEATYALAIFCVLKDIPTSAVLPHLKKYLRPVFKTAIKEIKHKDDELTKLRAVAVTDSRQPKVLSSP